LSFKTINILKNLPDELNNETSDAKKLAAILKTNPINNWKKSTFKNSLLSFTLKMNETKRY
jgi:hypothetical protein